MVAIEKLQTMEKIKANFDQLSQEVILSLDMLALFIYLQANRAA